MVFLAGSKISKRLKFCIGVLIIITYPITYPIKCINQAFTIHNNDFSYNYHTMDKNW